MLATRTDRRSMPRRGGGSDSRTTRDGKRPAGSNACSWPFGPTNSARNAQRHFTAGFWPAVRSRAERVRATAQPRRRRPPDADLRLRSNAPAIRDRRATLTTAPSQRPTFTATTRRRPPRCPSVPRRAASGASSGRSQSWHCDHPRRGRVTRRSPSIAIVRRRLLGRFLLGDCERAQGPRDR
jgi:hypothetical protein